MKFFIAYIVIINIAALLTMYFDKQSAIKHKWRTPESRLFFLAIILGSPGILSGMYLFRHKTKHLKFVVFIPLILLLQAAAFIKLFILK